MRTLYNIMLVMLSMSYTGVSAMRVSYQSCVCELAKQPGSTIPCMADIYGIWGIQVRRV